MVDGSSGRPAEGLQILLLSDQDECLGTRYGISFLTISIVLSAFFFVLFFFSFSFL